MEYNTPEPIVTERHSYLKFLLVVLFVAIAMSAALHGYLWYKKSLIPKDVPVMEAVEESTGDYPGSYGLNEEVSMDNPPHLSGVVYFTNLVDGLPHVFRYAFAEKKITPVGTQAQSGYQVVRPGVALVIARTTSTNEQNAWQPAEYTLSTGAVKTLQNVQGFSVENLAVSPADGSYAYSYQNEDQAAENKGLVENWNIAIHTKNGEVQKIEKAHEPVWLPNGTQLLYIAEDGVHRYDTITKVATLVFADYAPLSRLEDIAVSPDGKTVILTKPNENTLSVASFTETGMLQEVGRIVSDDSGYSRPLFSFDGHSYVVLATKLGEVTTTDDGQMTYTTHATAEIRPIGSAQVIDSIPVTDVSEGSLNFTGWLAK